MNDPSIERQEEGVFETNDGFRSLGEILGPAFEKRFVLAIRQAVNDCYDRPGVKGARGVELKLSITPVSDEHGNCLDIRIAPTGSAAASLPQVKLPPITCEVLEGGNARFRRLSPTNPRQRTIEEGDA